MRRLICVLGIGLVYTFQTVNGQTPAPPRKADADVREWLDALERYRGFPNEAAYDFGRLTPVTRETTPLLVEALRYGGAGARPYVANALGELGDQPEISVPALLEALAVGPAEVRNQAAVALIRTGAPSVPGLIRMLEQKGKPLYSPEETYGKVRELAVRRVLLPDYAAVALAEIGAPAAAPLVETFKQSPAAPEDYLDSFWRGSYAAYILGRIGEPAVPALRESLKQGGRTARVLALASLLQMEARAAAAVPEVAGLLDVDDPPFRELVFKVLKSIGPPAAPALTSALRNKNAKVRAGAADILDELVASAPEALPALAEVFLNDPESDVRFEARYALRRGAKLVGEDVVRMLTKGLQSKDSGVREGAAEILGLVGPKAATAARQLRESLRDPDQDVRTSAAASLIHMGAYTEEAAAVLLKDFKHLGYGDEKPAALVIAAGRDRTVVPSLARILTAKEFDDSDKTDAINILGRIGPGAKEAVPALSAIARASDLLRDEAADALAKIGAEGFPTLLEMTRSEQAHFRSIAYSAMGEAGRVDEKVVEVLVAAAAADPEDFVRAVAVKALGQLAPLTKKPAPVVIKALGDSSELVRQAAVKALAGFGPDAAAATPRIVNAIRTGEIRRFGRERERLEEALVTLAAIAPPTEEAAEALFSLLDLFDPAPPVNLINALARVGDPAITALPAALKKRSGFLGRNVHFVINRFGPKARGAVPALISLLGDGDPETRASAAVSLRLIGQASRPAWPALTRALSDRYEDVRFAAAQALLGTGHDAKTLGPLFNTAINDYLLEDFMGDALAGVSGDVWLDERREGGAQVVAAGGAGVTSASLLPPLPWPPPASSAKAVLPGGFLANAPSLKAAFDKTARALAEVGFDEYGLFETPGGFALVTRVERIREDGTSYPGADRWTNRKLATVDPLEILRQVFVYKPGQWRLFSFVFTTEENFGAGASSPTEEKFRGLHREGGKVLPEAVGRQPSDGRRCYVLIYRLEKKLGEGVQVKYDDPLSAEKHLRQAGLGAMFN